MGCRHCFVVVRLEDLVHEGGSRSSWRAHEHDSYQLVSQQNVAIQVFGGPCSRRSTLIARYLASDLRHGKQQVSPFYRDLFRFWSACCHEKNVFGALRLEGKHRFSTFYRDLFRLRKFGSDFHERTVDEMLAQIRQKLGARDFHHGKQQVSSFYRVSQLLHEKNVLRFLRMGRSFLRANNRLLRSIIIWVWIWLAW